MWQFPEIGAPKQAAIYYDPDYGASQRGPIVFGTPPFEFQDYWLLKKSIGIWPNFQGGLSKLA